MSTFSIPGYSYAYGQFEFSLSFPTNYPDGPPKVSALTTNLGRTRFNPNVCDSLEYQRRWWGERYWLEKREPDVFVDRGWSEKRRSIWGQPTENAIGNITTCMVFVAYSRNRAYFIISIKIYASGKVCLSILGNAWSYISAGIFRIITLLSLQICVYTINHLYYLGTWRAEVTYIVWMHSVASFLQTYAYHISLTFFHATNLLLQKS